MSRLGVAIAMALLMAASSAMAQDNTGKGQVWRPATVKQTAWPSKSIFNPNTGLWDTCERGKCKCAEGGCESSCCTGQ